MTQFFWMNPSVAEDCGYRAKLDKNLYHSEKFRKTTMYLQGLTDGEMSNWEMHLHKSPCDIVGTPFTPIVSEKFKQMADAASVSATYHSVDIFIADKLTDLKYFFAIPEKRNFVDKSTARVVPDTDADYPGWFSCNRISTKISYKAIAGLDWVKPNKAFGASWVVSETFVEKIKDHKITNFQFFLAKNSD